MTDARLEKMEIMLAHQDKQIQELSEVVHSQGKQIERLTAQLGRTQEKLLELNATAAEGNEGLSVTEQAVRDKPPHY